MIPTRESRHLSIDALRGWGSLTILLLHTWTPYVGGHWPARVLDTLLASGLNLMSVFFCISGYLVFLSAERLWTKTPSWKAMFYLQRSARILPLWWALLLGLFTLRQFDSSGLIRNVFFYFGQFLWRPLELEIVPAWSLFVEEAFYLVMPWLFPVLMIRRKAVWILVLALVQGLLWHTWATRWGVSDAEYFVERHILAQAPFFLLGICIRHLETSPTALERIGWLTRPGVVGPAAFLSVLCLFIDDYRVRLVAVPVLFWVSTRPGNRLSALASNRALVACGRRCYGIYILHVPVLSVLSQTPLAQGAADTLTGAAIFSLETLAVTLALAFLSFRWFEQPILQWARGVSPRGALAAS